jgi:hypothetical protein
MGKVRYGGNALVVEAILEIQVHNHVLTNKGFFITKNYDHQQAQIQSKA